MLKFQKMTVAEDVTTTEEILAVVLAEEAQLLEEKEILLQEERAVLEVKEVHLREKVASDLKETHQEEKVVFHQTDLQETVHQKELQDVLKALVILQDLEDLEEINKHCLLIFL